jgi:hypothetical protein
LDFKRLIITELKKMNIYSKSKKRYFLLLLLVVTQVSCEDYLDVPPEDKLVEEENYRNVFDADAAVLGIYGQFMNLAEEHVILNELRADLMSVTNNADPDLREIQAHNVTSDNQYASPKEFYEVILSCNDALDNFDKMLADRRMTQEEYNQRYSDIGALRSWVYLQLGIHFGNVPYVTDPLDDIDDIRDRSNFQNLSFDALLDELITFTSDLPYTEPYTAENLVVNVDGYDTGKFFINKASFLGDLHLWKGNYTQAATYYKSVMETASSSGNQGEYYDVYRVKYAEVASNNDLAVGYIRFRETDSRALVDNENQGWRSMFSRGQDYLWNTEWIWVLPFSSDFTPENPFIDLFSPVGGEYKVKPSQRAMDLWNAQTQQNGFPYDARGKRFSYREIGGQPTILKYIYNYIDFEAMMPEDLFEKEGQWFLYRAAKLHLRFAEAANRDNRHRLADALLNFGIQNAYTVDGQVDVTTIERTNDVPPYDFDARQGEFPYFRGPWYRNGGIRGRAYVGRAEVVGDSLISIENNLIQEAGLELAYEGQRWEDLVRIARRRNDPAFLADKVYEKLRQDGNANAAEVRSKLMNPENWYLPFEWETEEEEE